jgi:uncharacterized membrane protein
VARNLRVSTSAIVKTLQFLNVMLVALVMGVFWGTWYSLSRSVAPMDPGTFLQAGRLLMDNLGGPMSVLLPAAIASAAPVLYLLYRQKQSAALVFGAIGVTLMLGALVITRDVNVPLDYLFSDWAVETLPANWHVNRDRWEFFHGLRTVLSIAALAGVLASVLASHRPGHRVRNQTLAISH